MSYTPILNDPTEWNGKEVIKCCHCHDNLDEEEINEQDDNIKYCFNCFYSCCNVELDQDIRICPICKEHN